MGKKILAAILAALEVTAILLSVNIIKGINKSMKLNDDVLNEYDTYVIGEYLNRHGDTAEWIDNKGKIHKDTSYTYNYQYEYNNNFYNLAEVCGNGIFESIYNCFAFENKEPVKIKSSNPEEAVFADKYDNSIEEVQKAITIIGLVLFSAGIYCSGICLLFSQEKNDFKKC